MALRAAERYAARSPSFPPMSKKALSVAISFIRVKYLLFLIIYINRSYEKFLQDILRFFRGPARLFAHPVLSGGGGRGQPGIKGQARGGGQDRAGAGPLAYLYRTEAE